MGLVLGPAKFFILSLLPRMKKGIGRPDGVQTFDRVGACGCWMGCLEFGISTSISLSCDATGLHSGLDVPTFVQREVEG